VVYELNQEQDRIKKQILHFIKIGRYEKVKVLAADLITRYPSYPYGYYSMSIYEYSKGKVDNAIELCHKSLEYGMGKLGVIPLLMIYYSDKQDYCSLDTYFNALIKEFPFCNEALAIYGYSLWQRGKKDEGIGILQEAFSRDISNPMVIKYLFMAVKKKRNLEELSTLLKIYINSSASDKQKLVIAGLYEIYNNNWEEARKCYKQVLGMDPLDEEALHYMTIIELRAKMVIVFLSAVGWAILVYFIKFNAKYPITYFLFLPTLIIFTLIIVVLIKMRSI